MNFERINLLLDVFHKSLDVPHTDKIRVKIMDELKGHNDGQPVTASTQHVLALEEKDRRK